jgi:hypothetical protein
LGLPVVTPRSPGKYCPFGASNARPEPHTSHDPPGGVDSADKRLDRHEDWALETLADRQVEGSGNPRRQRHRDDLAALTGHAQRPMSALQAQRVDISAEGLGDTQPIQRQQRHQRVVWCRGQTRGDEQRPEFVAIQASRVRLVIEPGATHMNRG